jgi:homopolymeric O-antigen transport system permease protein
MTGDDPRERADDDLVDRAEGLDSFRGTIAALVQYRGLIKTLVVKDLKLKYRGSVFGFVWSLLNPLLMIIVYTIAFTFILGQRTEGFVFLLLLGILSWTFFVNSAMMSTGSIADNGGLLKSVFFPRAILPIATVLFNFAQYVLTVLVFLPVMLAVFGIRPAAPMLLYPVFLALQVVFTIGIALMIATGTVFFRDIRHLLEVALALMFWTTPIVYEVTRVPENLRLALLLSPLSSFVVAYKQIFFYRQWPDLSVWIVASAYAFGALAMGTALLLAYEDRFSEHV